MPSTLVHVSFAAILGTALLGTAFDRRAVVVVLAVAAIPDLDAFAVVIFPGAHRTLLHTMAIPALGAVLLALDTFGRRVLNPARFGLRRESILRSRFGGWGVRVAWVSLAAYAVAGVGLDMVMGGQFGGANVFWPFYDQLYRFDGHILYSTTDGFRQTFIEFHPDGGTVDAGQRGSSKDARIATPVDPEGEGTTGPSGESVERIFPIVAAGWQLWMVVTAAFVLTVRALEEWEHSPV